MFGYGRVDRVDNNIRLARIRSSVSVSSTFPFSYKRIIFNTKFEEKIAMRFRYFKIKMVIEQLKWRQ